MGVQMRPRGVDVGIAGVGFLGALIVGLNRLISGPLYLEKRMMAKWLRMIPPSKNAKNAGKWLYCSSETIGFTWIVREGGLPSPL